MTLESRQILETLLREEPCLGAVFTTFGFDPAFFEERVLLSVLRLSSDPKEQPERYHADGRRALQETPVVVVTDASERQSGRRLPYDVIDVGSRVFHPKAALLLYEQCARLHIGSANVTRAGYGGNAELLLSLELRYEQATDAALLQAFDAHLERVLKLARQRSTQMGLVREELARRLASNGQRRQTKAAQSFSLCDGTRNEPLLAQIIALLPREAEVTRVGLMAPFYERDDQGALGDKSVLTALRERCSDGAVLDVGVLWDNPPIRREPGQTSTLEEGLGRLWAWESTDADGSTFVDYVVPTRVTDRQFYYEDFRGESRRDAIAWAEVEREEGRLWPAPEPVVFAPRESLRAAERTFAEVNRWLYPAARKIGERSSHRPLHGKLILLSYTTKDGPETLVVVGSANMSRKALLLGSGAGGNVELCLAFRVSGERVLTDYAPELIYCRASAIQVRERNFPELPPNLGLAIEEAIHDPTKKTLEVYWANAGDWELDGWELVYAGTRVATGDRLPSEPSVIGDFELLPTTAELVLLSGGAEYSVPILVTDLVALPAERETTGIRLVELLMLLGGRVGMERVGLIRAKAGDAANREEYLEAVFGKDFGPTDIFRAWWAVKDRLSRPELSVPGFRLEIEGSLGVGVVWSKLKEAIEDDRDLSSEVVWFYGCELLRSLSEVQFSEEPGAETKREILKRFTDRVRRDLQSDLAVSDKSRWVERFHAFYGV